MRRSPFYQYPLDLHYEPALGDEDFFVSDSNMQAISQLKNWPTWPSRALLILGPHACGKTHLVRVWQKLVGAQIITPHHPHTQWADMIQKSPAVAIDPIEEMLDQTMLLHIINMARETSTPLLLTSGVAINALPFTLPDLLSRLKAMPMARVLPPDDHLLSMVLIKQCVDQHLEISQEVVGFVVPRIERTYEAVRHFVDALRILTLSVKRPPTLARAREALKLVSSTDGPETNPKLKAHTSAE